MISTIEKKLKTNNTNVSNKYFVLLLLFDFLYMVTGYNYNNARVQYLP